MSDLSSVLYDNIKKAISSWTQDDIYAISFMVYDEDDEPSKPTLTVGYNTIENYKNSIERALDSDEAKWNFAFWLQNEEYFFGRSESSAKLTHDWIVSLGFPDDYDSDENYGLGINITQAFVNILIDISLKLHNRGEIVKKFGKPIPIIIHELEYYTEIAVQNQKANPDAAISDFVKWIEDMYK